MLYYKINNTTLLPQQLFIFLFSNELREKWKNLCNTFKKEHSSYMKLQPREGLRQCGSLTGNGGNTLTLMVVRL